MVRVGRWTKRFTYKRAEKHKVACPIFLVTAPKLEKNRSFTQNPADTRGNSLTETLKAPRGSPASPPDGEEALSALSPLTSKDVLAHVPLGTPGIKFLQVELQGQRGWIFLLNIINWCYNFYN